MHLFHCTCSNSLFPTHLLQCTCSNAPVLIHCSIKYFFNLCQPVAEVIAHLYVHVSTISCWVVWSILALLGKNTDTTIVGDWWTGVGGHHALYCYLVQKSPIWSAWLASSYQWAFRISLSLIKFTIKKKCSNAPVTMHLLLYLFYSFVPMHLFHCTCRAAYV